MPINAIIDHEQNIAQKILPTLTLREKQVQLSRTVQYRWKIIKNRPLGTINRGENYRDYGKTNSGL